jgi:hypothetical protein
MPPSSLYLILALSQALASPPPTSTAIPPVTIPPAGLEVLGQRVNMLDRQQLTEALMYQLDEHVRAHYADRLAYLVEEQAPDVHLRVGLKGTTPEPDQIVDVAGTPVRVRFEVGQPYNAEEFSAMLSRIQPTITELFPDVTGIAGQSHLQHIEIDVEGTNAEDYQHAVAQIESLTGMKVKLKLGTSRPRDLIDMPH